MKKMASLFLGLLGVGAIYAQSSIAQNSATKTPLNPRAEVIVHDEFAPKIDGKMSPPSILIFSKTNDWRHNSGIAGGDYFFTDLADEKGLNVFTTSNGAVFNDDDLKRFKLVIFNNASGDILSAPQQKAFETWYQAGGNFIGLHGANIIENWPWYNRNIRGPAFIGHIAKPQFQEARVETLNAAHPVMKNVASEWRHSEEWYSFDGTPQEYGMTPLLGLDETTYSPFNFQYGDVSDLRMGYAAIDHPVIWSHCVGGGRSLYSALGHRHDVYENETYAQILRNGYDWMMNRKAGDKTGC